MLIRRQIRLKHETDPGSVPPPLSHIHRSLERIRKLQLAGFYRNNLQDRQLLHQDLWVLSPQIPVLQIPCSALQVQPLHIASKLQLLRNLVRVRKLRHRRIQRRLVQRPPLVTTSCLDQSCDVRFRNGKSREPDHPRLPDLCPVSVLPVPALEPDHPTTEHLLSSRVEPRPHTRQLSIVQSRRQLIQLATHTNLTAQCLLKVLQTAPHLRDYPIPPVHLLQQHHLSRAWDPDLLLQHRDIKRLRKLRLNIPRYVPDVVLSRHTPRGTRSTRLQVHQVTP
mmetsp:Transcript_10934/g.12883  ORF Transcript_10934/g.12883 Transcript_10934/m.12883 type:complete len:279 (+) Transcript_10934:376-1212(+)